MKALTRLVARLIGRPSEQPQAAAPTPASAAHADAPASKPSHRRKFKARPKGRVPYGAVRLAVDAPILEQIRWVTHGKR